mmetsp:Transcript_42755/g.58374  ORF Transcript_42755/g.58374 Transcript_42755/m.58374 type:complete len:111 (-) Transcript_42755:1625-1957(-)
MLPRDISKKVENSQVPRSLPAFRSSSSDGTSQRIISPTRSSANRITFIPFVFPELRETFPVILRNFRITNEEGLSSLFCGDHINSSSGRKEGVGGSEEGNGGGDNNMDVV